MLKANRWPNSVSIRRIALCLAILSLSFVLSGATSQARAFAPARPLQEMLNPDGTLNLTKGFSSLDARGWQLVSGSNEPPRFAPQAAPVASPGNQDWASNFTLRGVSGQVMAIALDRGGNVYAGGRFTAAGGVAANDVAKWNGSTWSAFGHGFNNMVWPLAVDSNNNVYAGGTFTLACDATCNPATSATVNRIAKWNGTSWSALGNGFDNQVRALAVDSSNNLYAGGDFTLACDATCNPATSTPVNRIAKWNGTSWSALGHGFNNAVNALAVDSTNNVYAGGYFTLACDATCNQATSISVSHIAVWNAGAWSAVSNGFNQGVYAVRALVVDSSNNVYAGGDFTLACDATCNPATSTPVNRIAKWNGTSWSALANGFNSSVGALVVDSSNSLYAGGSFSFACDATCNQASSTPVNRIARWNGANWSGLGNGLNGAVTALAVGGMNILYAGGAFSRAGSAPAFFIAKWSGSSGSWSTLGSGDGVNNPVFAFAQDSDNNIYAGGQFTAAGNVIANYIAKWDASGWSPMGNGFNRQINALAADSTGDIYAGGTFTLACDATCAAGTSTPVNQIAKWNGASWSAMGSGFNGGIYALAVDGSNNVYAGGDFTLACDATCNPATSTVVNRIAKWNGTSWSALGHGFDAYVGALAVDSSNNVYAGGYITLACDATCARATSITVNYIAKWNGNTWSAMGNGFDDFVWALAADRSGNVYAGGDFTIACAGSTGCPGGALVNRVAKWNGSAWSAMGNGFDNSVYALTVDGANLFAGGFFSQACDATCNPATSTTVNNIAMWDGHAWSALGSGTNDYVYALAIRGRTLFAGGEFTVAGGKVSGHIGSVRIGQTYLPLMRR